MNEPISPTTVASNTVSIGDIDQEETEKLVRDIVETVATAEDVDPFDLPPLYDTIDPDALSRSRALSVTIEFSYCGYSVVVHGDRSIDISDEE